MKTFHGKQREEKSKKIELKMHSECLQLADILTTMVNQIAIVAHFATCDDNGFKKHVNV